MSDIGEIIKSGATSDLTDMVKKFLGPALEEYGAIFADKVMVYRVRQILQKAGLESTPFLAVTAPHS